MDTEPSLEALAPDSFVISAGRSRVAGEPLNVPPVLASNFYLPSERIYARGEGTPTIDAFEEIMGGLEGGTALAFSSGMAAVAAVLHRLPVGAVLAVPEDPYHGVKGLAVEGEGHRVHHQGLGTEIQLMQQWCTAWITTSADCFKN